MFVSDQLFLVSFILYTIQNSVGKLFKLDSQILPAYAAINDLNPDPTSGFTPKSSRLWSETPLL